MTNRDALMGFFVGAIAGAAVAILYAPQSGEETRLRIRETGRDAKLKAQEVGERAKTSVIEAAQGAEQTVTAAASQVAGKANRVMTAVDRGREAFSSALTQG